MYLGVVKFKTKDRKFLRTPLIFTPIPLYVQEVWFLNKFPRENNRVAYTHIYIISFLMNTLLNEILYVFLLIFNWLSNWTSFLGHSNWVLVCGLEWDQKGKNKTLAPIGLRLFCQLLTSSKLPFIIFNIPI